MSIAIIINPIAGGARVEDATARGEVASRMLERHHLTGEVFVTERRGHARDLARIAIEHGARRVLVWGGDGTVSEVASVLASTPVVLGIVPAGSGNGLARELGLSANPRLALTTAMQAEPQAMDMGEIDGRLFVNTAGIGFDAHVAAAFDAPTNRRRGLVTYAAIAARALVSYRPDRYAITTGQGRTNVRAVLVTIANSAQFGNGARIAPGARVDDGLLDLVVVEERARWRTVCQLPRLFTGTVHRMPEWSSERVTEATIECDQPMLVHLDGEPVQAGCSLKVRVHPGVLLVAVGQRRLGPGPVRVESREGTVAVRPQVCHSVARTIPYRHHRPALADVRAAGAPNIARSIASAMAL